MQSCVTEEAGMPSDGLRKPYAVIYLNYLEAGAYYVNRREGAGVDRLFGKISHRYYSYPLDYLLLEVGLNGEGVKFTILTTNPDVVSGNTNGESSDGTEKHAVTSFCFTPERRAAGTFGKDILLIEAPLKSMRRLVLRFYDGSGENGLVREPHWFPNKSCIFSG